jgi:hypothetical protein
MGGWEDGRMGGWEDGRMGRWEFWMGKVMVLFCNPEIAIFGVKWWPKGKGVILLGLESSSCTQSVAVEL